jgi:hypothetical protein
MTKLLLKNKLTAAFLFLLFAALAPIQMMAQKKVLFICNSAFNGAPSVATSSAPEADPFIKLLQADPTHFTVTTITTVDGTTSVQKNGVADVTALQVGGVAANSSPANIALFYANYDLVVTQESFGSASPLWKPAGLLGIKNMTIPVIYTKGYSLRNGLGLTDVAGTPVGNVTATAVLGSKLTVTVPPASQTNPLFTGVDFTAGNDISIFKKLASDKGLADDATSIKAVDQVYNVNITNVASGDLANQKITLLASIDPAAGPVIGGAVPAVVNPDSVACINDIPGGTYFGTAGDMLPTTSRMIFFAYNYGALSLGYSDGITPNVTDAGLKIFKNAALILTGQSLGVNKNTLASDSVSVSPNPTSGVVTVNSASALKGITVYDAAGKKVSASKTNTVDLSNQAKGVYLVQVQTENGSTTKKIVVE